MSDAPAGPGVLPFGGWSPIDASGESIWTCWRGTVNKIKLLRIMKRSLPVALAASFSLMGASASNAAALLHYSFSPGSYYDYLSPAVHTPVTGSFDFDTATGALSNVNYTSVSGTFTTGAEYNPGDATQIYFGQFGSPNYDVYQLASSLTNGGTVAISSGTHPGIPISAGGSLTTGAVPEPATWAMMLVGLGGIGAMARSRRRKLVVA